MSDEPATPFDKLTLMVREIETSLRQVVAARKLPSEWASDADRIVIYADRGYNNDATRAAITAAEITKKQTIAEMRHRGEVERDKRLREINLKLESLRAVLPNAAVAACIHLGKEAREAIAGASQCPVR